MRRREFIAGAGAVATCSSFWPLLARAQQPAMPVIGFLSARSSESDVSMVSEFYRGLKDAGYVVDKNVAIEFRWGDGQYDRLPALAQDLVRRNVAVIVTAGGEISASNSNGPRPGVIASIQELSCDIPSPTAQ